jgi:hypothetical protein
VCLFVVKQFSVIGFISQFNEVATVRSFCRMDVVLFAFNRLACVVVFRTMTAVTGVAPRASTETSDYGESQRNGEQLL